MKPFTLPDGKVGDSYQKNFNASGGHGPYTFMVSNGSLPTGLTLSSAGVLSGTLTAEGTFTFTITATDSQGCTGKRQYTVTVGCPAITVRPSTLPDGTVGHSYHKTIYASGGNSPYTFMVSNGSLPPGLTLSAEVALSEMPVTSGASLSGTPTTEGTFTFTITATDSFGCTGKREYTVEIKCPTIAVNPFMLPNGRVGLSYIRTITASGGNSPYTFMVEDGSLPNGLTLSPDGILSGMPTTEGTFTFTIEAKDSFGCTGKRQYTIAIKCPTITLSPSTLPNGRVGQSYLRTITASGGNSPYGFTVSDGSLPNGLALSSGGVLSGTPTATGSFTFTIEAKDNFGCDGRRQYTVFISHN